MPDVTPLPKTKDKPGRKERTAKSLKAQATELHSLVVHARDAGCVRCNNPDGRLECAHIFSRGYSATRTDENNAVALHSGCHRYLTRNPDKHVAFFVERLGLDGYRALRDKAYDGTKRRFPASFWRAEVERLSELLERLGA